MLQVQRLLVKSFSSTHNFTLLSKCCKESAHLSTFAVPKFQDQYFYNHPMQLRNGVEIFHRRTTIFNSLPSDVIWEGVKGPRGITKKRARGKRRVTKQSVDLNKGQILGKGTVGVSLPGLNENLKSMNYKTSLKMSNVDQEYFDKLNEYRSKAFKKRKRLKLPPLLRGWCGPSLQGQALPLPPSLAANFESRVIELKAVSHMVATRGRFRRFSAMVSSGNGAGVCGIGMAKAQTMRGAIKRAKDRSFRNLLTFNLKDGRTLWHDGYVRVWQSTIFARPAESGYGLVCHRLLKTLAKVVGIQDMHAKVEGSTKNYRCIAMAFLKMLSEQSSYSELSDRLGLHVVEFDQSRDLMPRVLSSPSGGAQFTRQRIEEPNTDFYLGNADSSSQAAGQRPNVRLDSAETTHQMMTIIPDADEKEKAQEELKKMPHMRPGASARPVLEVTNPRRKPEYPTQKPEMHTTFIDDLTFETSACAMSKSKDIQDVESLLHTGERNINTIIAYSGRLPRVSRNPLPFYLNSRGVRKMAAIRHRFRNHDDVNRKRKAYADLDAGLL